MTTVANIIISTAVPGAGIVLPRGSVTVLNAGQQSVMVVPPPDEHFHGKPVGAGLPLEPSAKPALFTRRHMPERVAPSIWFRGPEPARAG